MQENGNKKQAVIMDMKFIKKYLDREETYDSLFKVNERLLSNLGLRYKKNLKKWLKANSSKYYNSF